MLEATAMSGASREALHEIDGTIESLSRLLDDMRAEHARQAEETEELRKELVHMREREESLTEALTRLRHWLALDTEAMLSPAPAQAGAEARVDAGLAGLEAGAEQLRVEADTNKRLLDEAQQDREDDQQTLSTLQRSIADLTRRLESVTGERDDLMSRLEAHEKLLETAGLEIEWRPAKAKGSR